MDQTRVSKLNEKESPRQEYSDVYITIPVGGLDNEVSNNANYSSEMGHHKTPSDMEHIMRQSIEISDVVVAQLAEVDSDLNEDSIDFNDEQSKCFCTAVLVQLTTIHSKLFGGFFPESLLFAFRFSTSTIISCIFLLAFPLNDPFYESIFILVTVSVVSWNSSNDSGTILKKLGERTVGTILGAALAFAVGYISLAFGNVKSQGTFLGFAFAIESFLYPYIADRLGYRSSYSAIIGNVTFGIAVSGFYDQQSVEYPWKVALFRVINIIIGCFIVAVVSLTIFPISTMALMMKSVADLLVATGKSTEMILKNASDTFQSGRKPPSIPELLWTGKTDDVHSTYVKNLDGWKDARTLLTTLKYDPWFIRMSKQEKHLFQYYMIVHIARTFRIQISAVLLDGIIRSDADFQKIPPEAISLFVDIGAAISQIMDVTIDLDQRKAIVKLLLEHHLLQVRLLLSRTAEKFPLSPHLNIAHIESVFMSQFSCLPLSALNAEGEQTLMVLHLVEQLILRVARVYFNCQQYSIQVGNLCGC